MRIAVVSDIQGNLTALEAVIRDLRSTGPDLVVHAGDLVANGSSPAEVIDIVRDLNWPGVYGNTDEMLWRPDRLQELAAKNPERHGLRRVLFQFMAHVAQATVPTVAQWDQQQPAVRSMKWVGDFSRLESTTCSRLARQESTGLNVPCIAESRPVLTYSSTARRACF